MTAEGGQRQAPAFQAGEPLTVIQPIFLLIMNKITQKWIATFLVVVTIILLSHTIVNAQPATTSATSSNNQCLINPDSNLIVTDVELVPGSGTNINMRDTIDVTLEQKNPTTSKLTIPEKLPKDLILYLNGYPMKGLFGVPSGVNKLRFKLVRNEESKETWNTILSGFVIDRDRTVSFSVGCPQGYSIPTKVKKQIAPNFLSATILLVVFAILLYLFFKFCRDSIRDNSLLTNVSERYNYKPPFSLARSQMAWWFFIIMGSFLFIFAITGDFTQIINEQALILIGISASTAISSVFIDDGKKTLSPAEIKQINLELQKLNSARSNEEETQAINKIESIIPYSSSWIKDILTTKDGINFYRFQIFVWTLILGIIFLLEVVKHLQFPSFDSSLLTLQGISAGTYLGLKLPEKPKSSNNELTKETETTKLPIPTL